MLDFEVMPSAERFFKKIKTSDPELFQLYKKAITKICDNPHIGTFKKGDLTGYMSYDIIHNDINYEMAYVIAKNDDGKIILVVLAGTRENFYEELKKYIKANKKILKSYLK